jgi:hypothetical protein
MRSSKLGRNPSVEREPAAMRFEPFSRSDGTDGDGDIASRSQMPQPPADELLAEELARCSDCRRTPLIGEYVHLYGSTAVVCELCRVLRSEMPVSSALVSHGLGPAHRNDPAFVVRVTRR